MRRILQRIACGVKRKAYNILWYGCGAGIRVWQETRIPSGWRVARSCWPRNGGENGECDERWV